ncbi:MAG TPA: OmpA family protein, partial [Polyangia bacterium]
MRSRGFAFRRRNMLASGLCMVGLLLALGHTARGQAPDDSPEGQPATDPTAFSWRFQFVAGSSSLKDGASGQASLRALSLFLLQHRELTRLRIEGHTNSRSAPEGSLALSRARALEIRSRLIQLGVEGERLVVVGFGSMKPIADNATAAGRALNDRVEVRAAPPTTAGAPSGSPTDDAPIAARSGAKDGAVDKYGGHVGSDGFYYDRFGGYYDQYGYMYKDGSYKSRCGSRYDVKTNKVLES